MENDSEVKGTQNDSTPSDKFVAPYEIEIGGDELEIYENDEFYRYPGYHMEVGDVLPSNMGTYFAILRSDGRLCVYAGTPEKPGKLQWNSSVETQPGHEYYTVFQSDGNLCTYRRKSDYFSGGDRLVWSISKEPRQGNFFLVMQNDSNLCVYRAVNPRRDKREFIWGSNNE